MNAHDDPEFAISLTSTLVDTALQAIDDLKPSLEDSVKTTALRREYSEIQQSLSKIQRALIDYPGSCAMICADAVLGQIFSSLLQACHWIFLVFNERLFQLKDIENGHVIPEPSRCLELLDLDRMLPTIYNIQPCLLSLHVAVMVTSSQDLRVKMNKCEQPIQRMLCNVSSLEDALPNIGPMPETDNPGSSVPEESRSVSDFERVLRNSKVYRKVSGDENDHPMREGEASGQRNGNGNGKGKEKEKAKEKESTPFERFSSSMLRRNAAQKETLGRSLGSLEEEEEEREEEGR